MDFKTEVNRSFKTNSHSSHKSKYDKSSCYLKCRFTKTFKHYRDFLGRVVIWIKSDITFKEKHLSGFFSQDA